MLMLMLVDVGCCWSQLIYAVSRIMGKGEGEEEGGGEVRRGRQGVVRETQGGGKGWLVDVV